MGASAQPVRTGELAALFTHFHGRSGVVLAVSGGADSTALMLLAARWRAAGGSTPLAVATIDHGLRPASRHECETVMQLALRLGIPGRLLAWEGDKPPTRLQERARAARYALLAQAAGEVGADAIATAHTLDDQAETVLMRLARGSALDGLGGMRPQSRRGGLMHLRPLLSIAKARLMATLEEAGIDWIEDPSNADQRFERVRIRQLLDRVGPAGLDARRLAAFAARARRATEALDAEAGALLARIASRREGDLVLEGEALRLAPAEIRLRTLALALEDGRRETGAYPLRLERLEALCDAVEAALSAGAPLRRTLGGTVLSVGSDGSVTLTHERVRRRGRPVAPP
jgi:tRNA(Ile)-lysidine synthase